MTITLHWWMAPIGLFLAPFIYRMVCPYESTGGYFGSIDVNGFLIGLLFWAMALGCLFGHFL